MKWKCEIVWFIDIEVFNGSGISKVIVVSVKWYFWGDRVVLVDIIFVLLIDFWLDWYVWMYWICVYKKLEIFYIVEGGFVICGCCIVDGFNLFVIIEVLLDVVFGYEGVLEILDLIFIFLLGGVSGIVLSRSF